MSVKIAKNSGFCFGVKRAINIAFEAAKQNKNIVTLGPIIHNPQMVKKLEDENIVHVDDIKKIDNRTTIIRSHGIEKNVMQNLEKNGIKFINATCPYVSKTQQYAEELSKQNYQVIILGDKNHPEVIALRSYAQKKVLVVAKANELPTTKFQKIGIISQTTRRFEDFQNLVDALLPQCTEMRVINTICNATSVRQISTLELAKESDLMIVIGGKNSSNTKMLAKISTKFVKTHHVETANEIEDSWFSKIEKVGLTAGASTPDWVIVEVYNKVIEIMGNVSGNVEKIEEIPGF